MEGCHCTKIFFSCQKPAFHSFYIFIPPMFTNNYCSVVFSFSVCWELISSSIMHVNAFMDWELVRAPLYVLVMGDSKQCFHLHEKFVGLLNFKNHKMEFMSAQMCASTHSAAATGQTRHVSVWFGPKPERLNLRLSGMWRCPFISEHYAWQHSFNCIVSQYFPKSRGFWISASVSRRLN